MKNNKFWAALFIMIFVFSITFLFTAGIWAFICWAFGWAWSWQNSLAVWSVMGLLLLLVRSAKK